MVVKKGDKVKIEYIGSFEDGTVFDASEKHGQPLEFEAGTGKVIKGFDKAIIGMKVGQEKEVTIKPEEGYGMPHNDLVRDVPRDRLPKDQEPKPGMMLIMGTPDGQQIPARIVSVTTDTVKIDLNHPLAGRTLKFKLKLVK
ncbi:MAG: peptidylprolyl isomerase [archaeon]